MLDQILSYLHNWFIAPGGVHRGTYTIENGGVSLSFLQNGQYFRIVGSVFNDGLHQYPAEDLTDEQFTGAVWALAVPKAVVSLSAEVGKWQEKNGEMVASPFTSESFGGYSYTKASGADGSGSGGGWQGTFASQLAPWRKIREYGAITNGGRFEK